MLQTEFYNMSGLTKTNLKSQGIWNAQDTYIHTKELYNPGYVLADCSTVLLTMLLKSFQSSNSFLRGLL